MHEFIRIRSHETRILKFQNGHKSNNRTSQFKAVLILWSANDLDKVELFSSFPSTAYCVGQFGVNQLVKLIREKYVLMMYAKTTETGNLCKMKIYFER